ncbi:replication protein [Lactobacillus sp. ESL0731]|uniref:replication protein n=1 Tax=unclassified Lactobacillus TaxID=2620435 RepID=UPI0023F92188|nr:MULTISPECIES: replication protein [unclassified Lactobacillus]WEV51421.1 replication protein [Lactobacillus sp. ESL0700]WEV62551.1 replication protein [Lactobacillus sp. ESL0731]
MTKQLYKQRSTKWAFLIYKDSAPENYLEELEHMHVPFVLSPWHDKDVNSKTGEIKKAHKHGALYFDTLKSYPQVSELISSKLNGPAHVEPVMSPKGMYDYFTHADNPEKTPYDVKDIESGAGFDLDTFLMEQDKEAFNASVIDVIEKNDFTKFNQLVLYARYNDPKLLNFVIKRAYFVSRYLESRHFAVVDKHKEAKADESSKR